MTMKLNMTGRVADCVQLTYRTPSASVRGLLPDGLELVTRGPWAFWNVMACRVERLRPSGVPALAGLTYHHLAYRLVVQAMNDRAEVVRGLYFTRSDVDATAVKLIAQRLTDLKPHAATIALNASDCGVNVQGCQARVGRVGLDCDEPGAFVIDAAHAPARLASNSCFPTVEDVRQFCRYTPNGLSAYEHNGQRLLQQIKVERSGNAWSQTPLVVREAKLGYFDSIDQARHVHLEWACRLGPMDYKWRVGEQQRLLMQPMKVKPSQAPEPALPATSPVLS